MEKIKLFFKNLKWYDYVILAVFIITMLTVGLVFHSNAITILNAILGSVGVYFIAKANIVGQFITTVQVILYLIISYFNGLYGEVIISAFIMFPFYIVTIILWFKNLNKKSENVGEVRINKGLTWKEWVIMLVCVGCVTVAIFFLLRHFNTRLLVLSTLSVAFTVIASYLSVRRSEFSFIFYIISNIIGVAMWIALVIQDNNLSQLITFITSLTYLLINTFGIFNWLKLKKKQEVGNGTFSTSR